MTQPTELYTVPIMDPNRGFRMWNLPEIYTGPTGTGRYVPNPDDMVVDWSQGFLRVNSVDYSTGISHLVAWTLPKDAHDHSDEDLLLGVGPGYDSESWRCFIDTSVMPHTLAIDGRLHIYGSQSSYIKVFRGTNIGVTGEVISSFYDSVGNLLGENIPLELALFSSADTHNVSVKVPMVGYTTNRLDNGEIVTVVAYNEDGGAVSIAKLVVMNTAFVRTTDREKRYVTGISLNSPFLHPGDSKVMEYPINLPVRSVPVYGVVHYSDGRKRELPIDGTKFNLYGTEHFTSSVVGQRLPLVLTYKLSENEYSYSASVGNTYHLSEQYIATTTQADRSYGVKLFVYPVWIDSIIGYRLEYFLYSLQRDRFYHVTPYVELAVGSRPFHPTEYGVVQELNLAIELDKIHGGFGKFRHVQTVAVSLLARGDENRTCWTVRYAPGQEPEYGMGLRAEMEFVNVNHWRLRLDNGFGSKEEWLRHLYYGTLPLHDPTREAKAPEPTHFNLVFANRKIELGVSQWNAETVVPNDLATGELLYLEWMRRTPNGDLQLAISGLRVQQL